MHIPPDKMLPQDLVDVFDHGPDDKPFEVPAVIRMHSTDAKHAMSVEPKRYALEPRGLARPMLTLVEKDESDPA